MLGALATTMVLGVAPASADGGAGAQSSSASADLALDVATLDAWHSGHSIAVKGASRANGAEAIQFRYTADGNNNDIMIIEYVNKGASDLVRIKPMHTYTGDSNVHNDKCLAVEGASTATGATIGNYACTYDSVNNDVWHNVVDWAYNSNTYRNQRSGLCLVVKGASRDVGASLVQHACNGTANGIWRYGLDF